MQFQKFESTESTLDGFHFCESVSKLKPKQTAKTNSQIRETET